MLLGLILRRLRDMRVGKGLKKVMCRCYFNGITPNAFLSCVALCLDVEADGVDNGW